VINGIPGKRKRRKKRGAYVCVAFHVTYGRDSASALEGSPSVRTYRPFIHATRGAQDRCGHFKVRRVRKIYEKVMRERAREPPRRRRRRGLEIGWQSEREREGEAIGRMRELAFGEREPGFAFARLRTNPIIMRWPLARENLPPMGCLFFHSCLKGVGLG